MAEVDMSEDYVSVWVIVRRYDEKDADSEVIPSSPIMMKFKQNSDFNELKAQIRSCLGLPENGKVIKLRLLDERFVALSTLLEGNTEESPFLLDVTRIYQHTVASPRTIEWPIHLTSIRENISSLERRVEEMEKHLPELRSQRQATIEQVIEELSSKVSFLDRRLDELAPAEWRDQIQQSGVSSESPNQTT